MDFSFVEARNRPFRVTVDEMGNSLSKDGIAFASGFESRVETFIDFISLFGSPLTYYGGSEGSHPDHEAIHRVRYEVEASERGELHAIDGPLDLHSAQSLRDPRPKYFCLFMVDAGWQGEPFGKNGESVLSQWSKAFEDLRDSSPESYGRIVEILLGGLPFPDGRIRSLAYRLGDSRGEFDLGVRLKYDLLEHLDSVDPGSNESNAVDALVNSARKVALRLQLKAGELVILDNDRWAHGRSQVRGQLRTECGSVMLNPRELWSVTVA